MAFFVIATGFKPVTGCSVVSYSIQLSYAAIAKLIELLLVVTATGFKPVTGCSVVSYSIQLSYAAIAKLIELLLVVTATGFKPVTGCSVVSYSIQLSYAAIIYCSFVLTGAKIRTFFENASVLLKLFSKNYSMKRELNNCQPSVKPTFQSLDGEL